MNNEKEIDILFGAFDSELYYQEIYIPDGFEATIKDNKIILKRKESEDERMVKFIKNQLFNIKKTITEDYKLDVKLTKAIDWLEKQGKQKPAWSEEDEMMIEETLYFLREYQHSNRCKDENGMQNSVTCENWLKSLKDKVLNLANSAKTCKE